MLRNYLLTHYSLTLFISSLTSGGVRSTINTAAVDIRRFGAWFNDSSFLSSRAPEVLQIHYQLAWPNRELESGRDLRVSPLHVILNAKGALFGQKAGWERPVYFSSTSLEDESIKYSFGKQNWFENVRQEVTKTRESVGIFDFCSPLVSRRVSGRNGCCQRCARSRLAAATCDPS